MYIGIHVYIHTYVTYTHVFVIIMTQHTMCQVATQNPTFQHFTACLKGSDYLQMPLSMNTPKNPHKSTFSQAAPGGALDVQPSQQKTELRPFPGSQDPAHAVPSAGDTWGLPSGLEWAQSNHHDHDPSLDSWTPSTLEIQQLVRADIFYHSLLALYVHVLMKMR